MVTLAALQTEMGVIVPTGDRTVFEAGLAAGFGGLGIEFGSDCDGPCVLGGRWLMAAPVMRWSRRPQPGRVLASFGLFARAGVPLATGNFRGYNNGFGVLFLFGVDLVFASSTR